ncbi:unnamed protein product [Heligmosomoides polygyrus]|uniref:Uncharacterized protein n=1 Tax=Heligmosomoides polygyrus TaxID=6339 RepID=A0A183F8W7_HELPZ|nr:unnamed protein product [Heligmosomoides polygyrus]
MERQFNAKNGAKPKIFERGDNVNVSDYKDGKHKWTNGSILDRIGEVLYKVRCGTQTWIRHANQLRRRYSGSNNEVQEDMDTLFETFDLERPELQSQAPSPPPAETSEGVPTVQQGMQLRRSTRTRRPTKTLHIDPTQKRYHFCP